MPPLEAMSCRSPIFSSNVTSLPKMVSWPEVMFDPHSTTAIRDIIVCVLTDDDDYYK